MKPSVDGRRGDRSGWKLVGNSSKWERPVGWGRPPRLGHASPITGKTKTTQLSPSPDRQEHPFSVYMRDVGNFRTQIHSLQIRDTYFTCRAVRCLCCIFLIFLWFFFHLQINNIEKCLHWCGLDPSNKARAVYIYLSPKIYSDANTDWEQFF